MTHLLHDLRFGIRSFYKTPGFTVVAVLVLGLGIGANSAIFTIVNQMLFRPLSSTSSEWVGVYSHDRTKPDSYRAFSYPAYVDVRDRSGVFAGVTAHTFAMVGVTSGDGVKRTFAELVSANYFDTLSVPLALGRPFTSEEERPGARRAVVIVGHQYRRRQGLDPAILGKTIKINAQTFTIIGVTPSGFSGTMAMVSAELFLPLGVYDDVANDLFRSKATGLIDRENSTLTLVGRVKPGLGAGLVNGRLEALSRQLEEAYPAENKNQVLSVSPLPRMSSSPQPQDDMGLTSFAWLLLALSGAVLLIACLNLANMLLARGAARGKEIAVRLSLGASRGRIVMQLLTEGVMLAVCGAGLGLMLSYWTTGALARSMAAAMPLDVAFDPAPDRMVVAVTAGFAMLSTVLFGLGPALKISRRDLVTDLKDSGEGRSPSRRWFAPRNVMVMSQVSLCLALLVAAGIFARAALGAAITDPGYRYDRLVLASLDPSLSGTGERLGRRQLRAVLERVRTIPGVEAAGMSSTLPFGDTQEGVPIERVGAPTPEEGRRARRFRIVSAGYFASLGLKMVRGREFTAAEEASEQPLAVCVIDEAMARRLFGSEDPLGQTVRLGNDNDDARKISGAPMLVVGIAPPLREELLDPAPTSHVYVPFGHQYRAGMHVQARVSPGLDLATMVDTLRREIRAAEPRLPVLALMPMQSFHDRSLELWALKTGGQLFVSLGLLALTLAVVGVYGLKSYVVSHRTREIGIRMALGASASDVLRLILADGVRLAIAGLAIGIPLAVLLSLAFTKVFVEIGGIDLLVIGIATSILGTSAIAASAVPAWRAARIVPLKALRTE